MEDTELELLKEHDEEKCEKPVSHSRTSKDDPLDLEQEVLEQEQQAPSKREK